MCKIFYIHGVSISMVFPGIETVLESCKEDGEEWIFLSSKEADLSRYRSRTRGVGGELFNIASVELTNNLDESNTVTLLKYRFVKITNMAEVDQIYIRCLRFSASAEICRKAQPGTELQTSVHHISPPRRNGGETAEQDLLSLTAWRGFCQTGAVGGSKKQTPFREASGTEERRVLAPVKVELNMGDQERACKRS